MQVYPRITLGGDSTAGLLLKWKVGLTILHTIAIISTIFRVWYRHHIRRLWWDDYLAVVPTSFEIVYLVSALWLRLEGSDSTSADTMKNQLVLYWVSSIPFLCILWTTRMCLALSIARIFAPGKTPRRFALALVVIFCVACIVMMTIAKTVTSPVNDHGGVRYFFERPNCNGGKALCIVTFSLGATADCVLTISPLLMLWHVKLPRNQRYLIFAVFSASSWTLVVSIVYILYVFGPLNATRASSIMQIMMPHIESAIAVFVCNFAAVVSFLYRTLRHYGDMDTVATSEESSRTGPMITTTNPRTFNSSVLILTSIISTSSTSVFSSSDDFEAGRSSKPSTYE